MYKLNLEIEIEKLKIDKDYGRFLCNKVKRTEPKISKEILVELLNYAKQNNLDYAVPWILHNLAWTYSELNDIYKATVMNEKAYNFFESNDNIEGLMLCSNLFMVIYSMSQVFDLGIEWGIKAIELAEKNGSYEIWTRIKSNLAALYIDMEEYSKAKTILEQLESLSYTIDEYNEVINYTNRATCELKMNNLESALEYANKSYDMCIMNNIKIIPIVLKEIGCIYVKKKMYEEAEEKFKESIRIGKSTGFNMSLTDTFIEWIDLDLLRGEYAKVIEKSEKLLCDIDKNRFKKEIKKIYLYNSKAYKGMKDYEKAYFYLEKYTELETKMENEKCKNKIKDLDKKKEEEEQKTYKILYSQTEALYSIGQKITSNLNKKEIFKTIAKEIETLIKLDALQILIYNKEEKILEYQLCIEQGNKIEIDKIQIEKASLAGYSIKNKKEVLINNLDEELKEYIENHEEYLREIEKKQTNFKKNKPLSAMFVPIMINDEVTGVISTQSYKKKAYTLKDLNTLKILSTYIGTALENSRLYREVQQIANYDYLTKLLNRRETLNRSREIYNKAKNEDNLCSIMIDIDNFKVINDTYGHHIGDEVIIEVAKIIKSSIRKEDIIGRYGGEEFIVIIDNEPDINCIDVGERIRENIEKLSMEFKCSKVTVSVGIANLKVKEYSLEEIIKVSDEALYKAKRKGKNKVVFVDKLSKRGCRPIF